MKKRSARPGDSRNHERRFSERQTARGEDDDNLATREGRPVRLPATTDAAEEGAEEVGGNALADGIAAAVDAALLDAGLAPGQLDRVFLTGGTSLVPAVRRLFEDRFGADRVVAGGEFVSVAEGLALIAGEMG